MIKPHVMKRTKLPGYRILSCMIAVILFASVVSKAQMNVIINMATIDGIALTPDNILNYQIQSSAAGKVQINGAIRYRTSGLTISYSFPFALRQGMNTLTLDEAHPQWQFSSSALQELFLNYKILPEGTFEYCVTVTPANGTKDNNSLNRECLYHRATDIFLINLIYPEDKARLKEFNPMLSWVANYSFSSELTYRVRVAEIKQGQNAVNAIMRNQPMYDEKNLLSNSIVYPVYAKPLDTNKWYAWTVDAYYKDVLLGGAEAWRFIIPDSIPPEMKGNRSYIDIKRENGSEKLNVLGELKLKYVLNKYRVDTLKLQLTNNNNEPVAIKPAVLNARYGDNRYILNLKESSNLKHLNNYRLTIITKTGESYSLPFKYMDPEYSH